jgi:uncharacterized protein YndB with AHSA1/START domain
MNSIEPPISDGAVKEKTGKSWSEWFAILDNAEAQAMSHKQIVAFLVENYQVGPWWQQMVTVTYEQARGMRQKHEMPSGYQISRSRTLAIPVERAFTAWIDETQRSSWLADPGFSIRKTSPNKSLRISWIDERTSLDVSFYPKGPMKTQITVQHNKLTSAEDGEKMKVYWAAALEKLEEFLNR